MNGCALREKCWVEVKEMTEREERFEKMLTDIQHNYVEIVEKRKN